MEALNKVSPHSRRLPSTFTSPPGYLSSNINITPQPRLPHPEKLQYTFVSQCLPQVDVISHTVDMASQPAPPSRTGSVGPPGAGNIAQAPAPPGGPQGNSQQNLNQIVSCHFSASLLLRDPETPAHTVPMWRNLGPARGCVRGRASFLHLNAPYLMRL